MRKKLTPILFSILLLGTMIAAQVKTMPEISLTTLDGKKYVPIPDSPKILFFFHASEMQNSPIFNLFNKLSYAFRGKSMEILLVYCDFERIEREELLRLQEKTISPLYIDLERQAMIALEMEKAPAVLVVDQDRQIGKTITDTSLGYESMMAQIKSGLGFLPETDVQEGTFVSYPLPDASSPLAETEKTGKSAFFRLPPEVVKPPEVVVTKDPQKTQTTDNPETKPEVIANVVNPPQEKAPEEKKERGPAVSLCREEKIDLPQTLGYNPMSWGLTGNTRNVIFAFALDLFVKLLPILIWGWGILYLLRKMIRYRGMFLALCGCLGFLSLHLLYLFMQVPFELILLSPEMWRWKGETVHYYGMLKPYHLELAFVFICQLVLLRGMAGRVKKEALA